MLIRNDRFLSLAILTLTSLALLLGGCNNQERAAELFTDAIILTESENRTDAIEKLKNAIELYPEFSMAHSMLGDIYQETGEYEESEKAYVKATELNEFSFHDFFNLGKVRVVLRKFADAAEAYVKACELEPENIDAHVGAARSYFAIKDEPGAGDNALDYAIRAKELGSEDGQADLLLGDIYQERKDSELAIESYKRALEIQGNDPDVMVSLAVSYLRVKRFESARQILENVLEIEPDNNPAYRYLGYYYIRMNDFEGALENYLMATQFDERDWNSHKGLGVAYMLRSINNDDDEARVMAIDHWKTSLAYNPRQPKLRELLKKYSKN